MELLKKAIEKGLLSQTEVSKLTGVNKGKLHKNINKHNFSGFSDTQKKDLDGIVKKRLIEIKGEIDTIIKLCRTPLEVLDIIRDGIKDICGKCYIVSYTPTLILEASSFYGYEQNMPFLIKIESDNVVLLHEIKGIKVASFLFDEVENIANYIRDYE